MDDVRLLERARRGDEEAFSLLFGRYQRAIYRYAVYLSGRDTAEDIVQETFLAVLQQTGRGDAPRGAVLAYLIGIARHRVLKRLTARRESLDEDLDAVGEPDPHGVSVLDHLTRTEMIDTVRAAVHALPAVYREAIVLCELQEMPYADAADAMGCPIGTVRSRVHRAKALLLSALQAKEIWT